MRGAAAEVAMKLQAAGYIAYFAGGCVRDKLLGKLPKDYDIATSATPADVLKIFPKSNEVGAHFGVMIVRCGGYHVEVATFRTDGSYTDGRRPDHVIFSAPEDDAARRDFTINALFENPATGEIIDYVGGIDDLNHRILRAVGDPKKRFQEDSLRLMRAVRFATALDFQIHDNTWQALIDTSTGLSRVSIERIRDEFSRSIILPHRRRALELFVNGKLIEHFIPEVLALIGCEQPPEWHPEGDVYEHTKIMLEMLEPDAPLDLCLAVLLHDIAKPPTKTIDDTGRIRFNGHDALGAEMTEKILRRMKYSKEIIYSVTHMVSRHMQFMNVQLMRTSRLKRFMSVPEFEKELELHRVDCASSNGFTDNYEFLHVKREEFANEPLIPPPLITGRDLISLGLSPSPVFSEILHYFETEQLEGRLSTREDALILLEKWRP